MDCGVLLKGQAMATDNPGIIKCDTLAGLLWVSNG